MPAETPKCQVCGADLDPVYGPTRLEPNPEVPNSYIHRRGPVLSYVCRRVLVPASESAPARICGHRHAPDGHLLAPGERL